MKKTIQIIVVVAVLISIFLQSNASVYAAAGARRNNIKSVGNIDVQIDHKTIYIAASDLVYLADEIDNLENTYKITTVDALNAIGTYFKSDGSFVHNRGLNEVDTPGEKAALPFGKIRDGILNSQSVSSLSQTQATDKDGNLLFYKDETARENKDLLNTTTANTGYPVYYTAATANNMTAGAAAWVNGALIKGTGADNAASYAQGIAFADSRINPDSESYKDGFETGKETGKLEATVLAKPPEEEITSWRQTGHSEHTPTTSTTYTATEDCNVLCMFGVSGTTYNHSFMSNGVLLYEESFVGGNSTHPVVTSMKLFYLKKGESVELFASVGSNLWNHYVIGYTVYK